jgi:hypothetical protein
MLSSEDQCIPLQQHANMLLQVLGKQKRWMNNEAEVAVRASLHEHFQSD